MLGTRAGTATIGIALALGTIGLGPASARAAANAPAFSLPVDFATGAVPSSAAFNAAAGDQLTLQLINATISDGIVTGDFDRDGKSDVVQTNVLAGSISIFRGLGSGRMASPVVSIVGRNPAAIVATRIDADDFVDLAIVDSGLNQITILRGTGTTAFDPAAVVSVAAPRTVAIGDFNADRVRDLAVASGAPGCPRSVAQCFESVSPAGGVTILNGGVGPNGQLGFTPSQFLTFTHSRSGQPAGANTVAVGDFDRNGRDDIAVAVGASSTAGYRTAGTTEPAGDDLLVYLNRGTAGDTAFDAAPSQPPIRVGAAPTAIAVGDWNHDRNLDLAVLNTHSSSVTTLLGGTRGRYAVRATSTTVGALPRSLTVADFDRDGISDLAAASFGSSTVTVLQGRRGRNGKGDGTFSPGVDFWAGDAPTAVAAADLTGDRRLDLVVARMRTDQMSLLANDPAGKADGVTVARDIAYMTPAHDPYATRHILDLYIPPKGARSLTGRGRPYPVMLFAHGGGGIAGDKVVVAYLARSLAKQGVLVVSVNYRLGPGLTAAQAEDVGTAFRWTIAHIRKFGGDPRAIVLAGTSAGTQLVTMVAMSSSYRNERANIRGLAVTAIPQSLVDAVQSGEPVPDSVVLSGTDGLEVTGIASGAAFAAWSTHQGARSEHVIVPSRDHLTLVANLAAPKDPGRAALIDFLRRVCAT